MMRPSPIGIVFLGLGMIASVARAQTAPDPRGPSLGRGHVWIKIARADFDDASAGFWGVDEEGFVGLEAYGGDGDFYGGVELGHARAGNATAADGDEIRDFDFLSLEFNAKKVFALKHGFTFGLGGGTALFYVNGEEVSVFGGQEFSDPLADLGFGAQGFVDLTWRARRFLIGVDVKYQAAFDILDVDYSNVRLGGHLGLVF